MATVRYLLCSFLFLFFTQAYGAWMGKISLPSGDEYILEIPKKESDPGIPVVLMLEKHWIATSVFLDRTPQLVFNVIDMTSRVAEGSFHFEAFRPDTTVRYNFSLNKMQFELWHENDDERLENF